MKSDTGISLKLNVIPDKVLYLNPWFFNLSRNILVSVVLNLLNICAIKFSKSFFTNPFTTGISLTALTKSVPFSRKYLSGVNPSKFSFVASFT